VTVEEAPVLLAKDVYHIDISHFLLSFTVDFDLHMGILRQQTAICTHPTATKTFLIDLDCTIQSNPLNVSAKEKIFLKTSRHVKDSTDMSPIHITR
jgi:hypothetical protein